MAPAAPSLSQAGPLFLCLEHPLPWPQTLPSPLASAPARQLGNGGNRIRMQPKRSAAGYCSSHACSIRSPCLGLVWISELTEAWTWKELQPQLLRL